VQLAPRLKLACLGDGSIVERALLRPNLKLGDPFEVELISRNDRRRAELTATYQLEARGRSAADALADESIRAVYISLPNQMHAAVAVAAIEAGKAVLVEKPLAVTLAEIAALQSAVSKYGGVLVEGVMTGHHSWSADVAEWVSSRKNVCAITRVVFPLSTERRNGMPPTRLGGGAWYDVASYWAYFLQATGLGLPEMATLISERHSRDSLDLALEIRAISGTRIVRLFAALDGPFEASHILHDGDDELRTPNFLRPAVGDSAVLIQEVRGGEKPTWR
jgi:predicted dehydrogenase